MFALSLFPSLRNETFFIFLFAASLTRFNIIFYFLWILVLLFLSLLFSSFSSFLFLSFFLCSCIYFSLYIFFPYFFLLILPILPGFLIALLLSINSLYFFSLHSSSLSLFPYCIFFLTSFFSHFICSLIPFFSYNNFFPHLIFPSLHCFPHLIIVSLASFFHSPHIFTYFIFFPLLIFFPT